MTRTVVVLFLRYDLCGIVVHTEEKCLERELDTELLKDSPISGLVNDL